MSAPQRGAFFQGEKRGAGDTPAGEGSPSPPLVYPLPLRGDGWPTALRLVSPCDADSEKRAVSAARGSGEGIEGCSNGAMLLVSLQRGNQK